MALKIKKTKIAIIGGGITGLTIAACLEREGFDYLIIEAQDGFGGLAKGQHEHSITLDFGMKSIPVGDDIKKNPLITLKDRLGLNIGIESWTDTPKFFTKDGWEDFVGFGETKMKRSLIEELNYYLQSPRLLVSGSWTRLIEALDAQIPDTRKRMQCHVTQFVVDENQRITHALINGDTELHAEKFIYTLSPGLLHDLFAQNVLPVKLIQKLAKTEPYVAVNLDIATKELISSSKSMMLFEDTVDEGFQMLGHFVTNADPSRNAGGMQVSNWMTLLEPEFAANDENVSKAIKTMKKLIKKAFPELIEKAAWERILVTPQALGQWSLNIEKNGTLSEISNLWPCGAHIKNEGQNLIAALFSAQMTANQFIRAVPAYQRAGAEASGDDSFSEESPQL